MYDKGKMMTQGAASASAAGGEVYVYKGLVDGFKHIVRTEVLPCIKA